MVKSLIYLSERESRIVNIVKAKYGLKDKVVVAFLSCRIHRGHDVSIVSKSFRFSFGCPLSKKYQ
jgi:hypothetical protein